ncbi:GNAT family N-acetyltransferase [Streptomyces tropicalis]|uniref:GNAT family N-acetyltransferase n=1 Tax=Streptomyces tropicalis TaxID=3034234 RepID=A0ABT6ABS1_9ACTN|nr:GNAT family N-acetyltransferase [Streptomyces tropicalis]MDF3302102.1 GNAT family N-acetyltransferase [Streptomyces tropicalis]
MTTVVPETVRTARLTLLPLAAVHADEMAAALSDPALHTFVGGTPATAQALRTRYARLAAGSPDPAVTWCNWVVQLRAPGSPEGTVPGSPSGTAAGSLTGTVQATVTGDGLEAEIAWVVGTPWQRHGIATEAARGLVAWLRGRGVRTVTAHIHPGHTASAAVATAAGLTPTGRWHDGEVRWELTIR